MSSAPTLPDNVTFHVVMNAGSGADDKEAARLAMEKAFSSRGNAVRFHLIDDVSRIQSIIDGACQACRDAPGVLVAAGGDGTVNAAAAAVAGSDIPFAVVPMGTFNYFARDIGMPAEPEAAALAILDGEIAPQHVASLNGRLFLVNASIGLYVRLMEVRERHEERLGRNRIVAVVSGLVTALGGFYGMTLDLTADGRTETLRAPLVFLGKNYLQLRNLDFDIADGVAEGRIGIILLRDARPAAILGMAWLALLGRLQEALPLRAFCVDRLEIRTRRRNVPAVIDGEIETLTSPLKVEVRRNALRVVRPRAARIEAEPNSLAAASGGR